MGHDLEAREYKILLNPEKCSQLVKLYKVNEFWESDIRSVIVNTLGLPEDGLEDFKSRLDRGVAFYDAGSCILTRHNFSLRDRQGPDPKTGEHERKISIKLRSPDLFVVASTPLVGKKGKKPSFEEDIAPLEATDPDGRVTLESPPSMRSRFSLVAEEKVKAAAKLDTWADAVRLFPSLPSLLPAAQLPAANDPLQRGQAIRELAFKGAECKLGDDVEAEFTLTLWFFASAPETVRIAEISYKCEFKNGFMPREAALRAFRLFVGLQTRLSDRIDLREASKTKLALPTACAKP